MKLVEVFSPQVPFLPSLSDWLARPAPSRLHIGLSFVIIVLSRILVIRRRFFGLSRGLTVQFITQTWKELFVEAVGKR
jgi:hypothetical protein